MSENDATVYAEALIMTVARAFYEDAAICIIDVLIRDKFLRDDQDMGTRLSLPPKQLRKTLQFLQEEHLVKSEAVDDLAEGGSQATKFWYIDYNRKFRKNEYSRTDRKRMYLSFLSFSGNARRRQCDSPQNFLVTEETRRSRNESTK